MAIECMWQELKGVEITNMTARVLAESMAAASQGLEPPWSDGNWSIFTESEKAAILESLATAAGYANWTALLADLADEESGVNKDTGEIGMMIDTADGQRFFHYKCVDVIDMGGGGKKSSMMPLIIGGVALLGVGIVVYAAVR